MVSTKTAQNLIFIQKRLAEKTMSLSLRDSLPPVRLARSRTPGFHPGNRGSNPLREAILSPPDSSLADFLLFKARLVLVLLV